VITKSRLRFSDLAYEALAGISQRPARSVLTILGTVLGIGAFAATLGITATAASQIDTRFTALAATEVAIEDIGDLKAPRSAPSFPPDSAARIQALSGAVHAGLWWPIPLRQPAITAMPETTATTHEGITFLAAEPSALAAMHPTMSLGRLYDRFHAGRAERVAVIGSAAAARLGITRLDAQPAIFVNGTAYTLVGIIGEVERMPETQYSIVIPTTVAITDYGPPTDARARMIVETELGAARTVAAQAALALRPNAPALFKVTAAPDPQTLRGQVTSDINILFLLLAGVSLTIGAVSIANFTLIGVLERAAEIGLRRSLGARPRHIAAQFLAESTALGLLGGLLGASLGVAVVLCLALAKNWTAIIEPWTITLAPVIGAAVGILSGAYPAIRAARTEPIDALRR
jgi:putative ABC transport system permease protein